MRPIAIALLVSLAATAGGAEPPRGLACLARSYALEPRLVGERWVGHLGSGVELPWDDGRTKSLDEALDAPDLEDTLARPYGTGPITPVTDPDRDPGRVRVDALFEATYPKSGVVPIRFFGRRLLVHRRVRTAFADAERALRSALAADPALRPWLARFSGTFVERNIAGTTRKSSHAFGVSIDLDAARTHYWRWQRPPTPIVWRNTVPQAIVDAFESAGFIWGGRWFHYDTMHFEYRPELLDPACR